ncbi:MAG: hypothetical protein GKR95_16510 [Gammaproteobacteria bacterium]|nr:hypothetical protein [Gammaproteobacteria bacterium]
MSQEEVYEIHQIGFVADTHEKARDFAFRWLSAGDPILDENNEPVLSDLGTPLKKKKFENIKETIITERKTSDHRIMLTYTVVGRKTEDRVYEFSRSL